MREQIYSVLNQQVIMLAVQALRQGDEKVLEQLGLADLDHEQASLLKGLNLNHLNVTFDFRGSLVEVKINSRQLNLFMDMALRKGREEDLIQEVIKLGLRQSTLEELKGIGRREFAARRARLGLDPHPKGRIGALSEEEELTVLRAWKSLETCGGDILERLIHLHELTSISLDRAWLAIQQSAS